MKRIFLTGLSLCLIAPAALAFSGVSPKFDGAYAGTAAPNPRMGGAACGSFPVDMTVKGGEIRGATEVSSVDGFVTEEGFIRGHLRRDGKAILIEGRMTGDAASAATIDN